MYDFLKRPPVHILMGLSSKRIWDFGDFRDFVMYFLPSICGIHKPKKYFLKEEFARRFLIFLFYVIGDDRLKISSDLKTNSWCIDFLILGRSWNYGRVWVTIGLGFSISSILLYSRVPPNSITFHIDFVFILMYVSIISQKFFTPIIEKFFTPLWKVFYPLDDHFHSISQHSLVGTSHTYLLGVWIRMVVGDGVKNFSGEGVKN